jgi:membrane dipeptidase
MRRRDFLTALGGAAAIGAGLAAQSGQEKAKKPVYRVIDAHLHIMNTNHKLPDHLRPMPREYSTLEKTLEAMDQGGISKAFLISYTSVDIARGITRKVPDPVKSLPVYSKEYMVDAWKKNPDRFWWFTDHIDPARPGYLDDLKRDFEAGASGAKILAAFHGFLPDHPGFMPVYEMCSELGKPVIVDGSFWYFNSEKDPVRPIHESTHRQKQAETIDGYLTTLETVFRGFPSLAISLAHAGTAAKESDDTAIFQVIREHPNAYCDIAAARGYSAEWLEKLVRAVGAKKVMYGTDWPYWVDEGADSYLKGKRRWSMIAEDCPSLSEQEKQWILAENAERFVGNVLANETSAKSKPASSSLLRAMKLHREHEVLIIHDHNPIEENLPKMLAGGVTGLGYQVGLDVVPGPDYAATAARYDGWAEQTMKAMDEAEQVINANPDRAMLVRKAEDFRRARRENKVAVMFGVEGGKLLEGKLEWLERFHQRGLRELQLTWAFPNQIVEWDGPKGNDRWLTPFGRDVVKTCNKLGVIICLTHISSWKARKPFYEVIELTEKPVILSHEAIGKGVEAKEVKALASREGVIGIHFFSTYLKLDPLGTNVDKVVEQADRIVQAAGIDTVALGVDFFPTTGVWRDLQLGQKPGLDIRWAIEDLGHMPRVTEALLDHGYSEEDVIKIIGGNYLRVCQEVFG